jgi:hypothetical protein
VTDAATTWLQLTQIVSVRDLVAAADFLIRVPRRPDPDDPRPHVGMHDLIRQATSYRGRGRRAALEAAGRMREGSDSPRETWVRLDLEDAGLPEPSPNCRIDHRGRFIGYGDLVYPLWKVVVEYDGEQHRLDSRQYQHDVARHEALLEAGWIHIRESKDTPEPGPDSTVARTRRALTHRGWTPSGH